MSDTEFETEKIQVVVRCRGRNIKETTAKSAVVVHVDNEEGNQVLLNPTDEVGVAAQLNSKMYQFDKVFGPTTDQATIFDRVASPLFDDFLRGYNCTLLVYGMTSSGKTYTMTGEDTKIQQAGIHQLSELSGIIPRVLLKLFDVLNESGKDGDYLVKCSFIELYNEELRDLLADDTTKKLRIFDQKESSMNNMNATKGTTIHIQNLEEVVLKSANHGLDTLQKGLKLRQVASTRMNDVSSRSHTIFTLTLFKQNQESGELFRISKMNLVDLAGSENISRSGALNQRAKEAGSINQSLLTLGRVINLLVEKSQPHIPYRESKLTRLLQDSLGGRTKTCLIATISPAKINYEETLSTLEYANKAKSIQNRPQVGLAVPKDVLVKELSMELSRLKSDLNANKSKDGIFMNHQNYNELMKDLNEYKTELQESNRSQEVLRKQNESLKQQLMDSEKIVKDQLGVISSLNSTVESLHNKIDKQIENEQSLIVSSGKFKEVVKKMNESLLTFKKFENKAKETILNVIDSQLRSLAENIQTTLDRSKNAESIGDDIEKIKLFQQKMIEELQSKLMVFHEKINDSNVDIPTLTDDFQQRVQSLTNIVTDLSESMTTSFSTISHENNQLKLTIDENLFKNHEEVVGNTIAETNRMIESDTNNILNQFLTILRNNNIKQQELVKSQIEGMLSRVVNLERDQLQATISNWDDKIVNTLNEIDLRLSKGQSQHTQQSTAAVEQLRRLTTNLVSRSESQNTALSSLIDSTKNPPQSSEITQSLSTISTTHQNVSGKNANLLSSLTKISDGISNITSTLTGEILEDSTTADLNPVDDSKALQALESEQLRIKAQLKSGKTPLRSDSRRLVSNNEASIKGLGEAPKFQLIGQRYSSESPEATPAPSDRQRSSIGQSLQNRTNTFQQLGGIRGQKRKQSEASQEINGRDNNKFQKVGESRIPIRKARFR